MEHITPEQAKTLLGFTDSRPINPEMVERYKQDILNGKWKSDEVLTFTVHGPDGKTVYQGFSRYRPRTPGMMVVCTVPEWLMSSDESEAVKEDYQELWLIQDLRGIEPLMRYYQDIDGRKPEAIEVYQFVGDRSQPTEPKPYEHEG